MFLYLVNMCTWITYGKIFYIINLSVYERVLFSEEVYRCNEQHQLSRNDLTIRAKKALAENGGHVNMG